MDKGFWVVLMLIALIVAVLVFTKVKRVPGKETKEFKTGKQDTVFVQGKPDTVFFSRVFEKIVHVPVEKIIRYGSDSSKVDTTFSLQDGEIDLGVTTYPAVDSLKFDIELLTVNREIVRVDTVKLTRVDTLVITRETVIEPAWYESWWFGSLVTAGAGITLILTGK
ncbi:MAG: hypothetical protein LCH52_05465 [Bacteroidetes bacterium]|nr:hypothetical protein [Bacteroidota bacterium]